MHFDMVIRDVLLTTAVVLGGHALTLDGQKKPESIEMPEMLATEQGILAINTPKGWVQTYDPGLAYFTRKRDKVESAPVWIYISSAPIGPDQEAKNTAAYIQSDIANFKKRFEAATVKEEEQLALPKLKTRAPVYTFRSGEKHNVIEQVVYVGEANRVLTLVLSAKKTSAFEQTLPVFHEFVKSYGGSVAPCATSNCL